MSAETDDRLKINRAPCIIYDDNLYEECDRLPPVRRRAYTTLRLLFAYKLIKKLHVVEAKPATEEQLQLFHTKDYISHIKNINEINDDYEISSLDEHYGLAYDCAPFSNMYKAVSTIAGASITAAKCLMNGYCDTVINWCGGWHHAQRSQAEGFCYINDVVLAIENLSKRYPRILYIDLDVHHGNGVEDAYNLSKRVFTLSFHKCEPGFYPGTGNIDNIGNYDGKGYTCNFPLKPAYCDDTLEYCFDRTFNLVYSHFMPDVMVVQCGGDCLPNDPVAGAGVTLKGYLSCVNRVLSKHKPTMLLGGGGYNYANTARLWASITGLVVGVELDEQIPYHANWLEYGPDYCLEISPSLTKDCNTREYLDQCIASIEDNLLKYVSKERERFKKKTIYNRVEMKSSENVNSEKSYRKKNLTKPLDMPNGGLDVYNFHD